MTYSTTQKLNMNSLAAVVKQSRLLDDIIDLPYIQSGGVEFESFEELEEYARERITEAEIIYYRTAIEFLKEHDPSLRESLELAADWGYSDLKALNSELLATLLYQQMLSSEFDELSGGIADCFEDVETAEEE